MVLALYSDILFKSLNDKRLILGISLLLTVILAYQLSILVWQIVPVPEPQGSQARPSLINRSDSSMDEKLSVKQMTDQIAATHLFGQVQVEQVATVVVEDAPESTLNYKVRGIYFSQDQSLASTIIEKSASQTEYYRLGDEIDNNIFISQIQADHVLINRRGRLEKLILEKPVADMNASIGTDVRAGNLPTSSSVKVLQSYKRRYADNPLALAKRFQAIPVSENGRNIGYKLKALRGERLLQKLELNEDDVFVEINGIGLDKPFEALDALKSLATADDVSVTVLRNGNRETMNFSLQ